MLKYSKAKTISTFLLEVFAFPIRLMAIRKTNSQVQNIAILEPFALGDVLSVSVMLKPLKEKYPNANIFLLTQEKNVEVYKNSTLLKETITYPFPWAQGFNMSGSIPEMIKTFKFLYALREYNWDIGIDVRGDIRSQIAMLVMGCNRRIAARQYLHSNIKTLGLLVTDKIDLSSVGHRFEYNLSLLRPLDITAKVKLPSYNRIATSPENTQTKHIILHPGGGWIFKLWSNDKWAELANRLLKTDEYQLTIIGGEKEKSIVTEISQKISQPHKTEITSFTRLKELISSADLFLGLDSGPMNLASVMNIPTVALFGPGDYKQWFPYSENSAGIYHDIPCSPCNQKKCIYDEALCMCSITVDEVYEATKHIANKI